MKKGKRRFELACYKNKVLEYRTGVESDLDEVLQIHQVFTNVSKGAVAPTKELEQAWPGKTQDEIILEILKKGELQVGEKERNAKLEQVSKEVVQIVVGKCVEPKSKRQYTPGMIEKALNELRENPKYKGAAADKDKKEEDEGAGKEKEKEKEIPTWHGVSTSKPAKVLALEAIKALVYHQPIPIARARMRIRVSITSQFAKKCKDKVKEQIEEILQDDIDGKGDWTCEGFVEPGKFKSISEIVTGETKGKGRVEVLDMAVGN